MDPVCCHQKQFRSPIIKNWPDNKLLQIVRISGSKSTADFTPVAGFCRFCIAYAFQPLIGGMIRSNLIQKTASQLITRINALEGIGPADFGEGISAEEEAGQILEWN